VDVATEACFLDVGRLKIEAFDSLLAREIETLPNIAKKREKKIQQSNQGNYQIGKDTYSRHHKREETNTHAQQQQVYFIYPSQVYMSAMDRVAGDGSR
jgi:hypothetical protein